MDMVIDEFFFRLTEQLVILTTINYIMKNTTTNRKSKI